MGTEKSIDDVKKKIQKLLALAERGSEHEAKVAMVKAQHLMMEYKLSIGDVQEKEIKVIQFKTELYYTDYKNCYRDTLANALSEFYCCTNCLVTAKGSKKHYIMLIGFENDVEILNGILSFADQCIMDWFKAFKKAEGWKYSNEYLNALKNQYGMGFAEGLKALLEEQTEEIEQEWGLVVVPPKEAIDYVNGLEELKDFDYNISTDKLIFAEGVEDGYNAPIQNKLA